MDFLPKPTDYKRFDETTLENFKTNTFDKCLQDYITNLIREKNVKPYYIIENARGYSGFNKRILRF